MFSNIVIAYPPKKYIIKKIRHLQIIKKGNIEINNNKLFEFQGLERFALFTYLKQEIDFIASIPKYTIKTHFLGSDPDEFTKRKLNHKKLKNQFNKKIIPLCCFSTKMYFKYRSFKMEQKI